MKEGSPPNRDIMIVLNLDNPFALEITFKFTQEVNFFLCQDGISPYITI